MGNVKPKVAVVYHFYAHYRSAIMRTLSQSEKYEFVFWGAKIDPANTGIQEIHFDESIKFKEIKSIQGPKGLLFQPEVLGLAIDDSYDAIIFLGNWKYVFTWLATIISKFKGKKVLFWTHGWIVNEKGIVGATRNFFYRLSDGLLLYGNWAKNICIEKGWEHNMLAVVYNSLDYAKQKERRETLTQVSRDKLRTQIFGERSTPVVVSIGRLTKRTKIDLLLRAVDNIWKQKSKKINVLIIGDGVELKNLKKFASRLEIDIHFYGACYDEDILAGLIGMASVVVAPAHAGLMVMHALAYGVPVITHDTFELHRPEVEAIKHGLNGEFYKFGSIEDLSTKITDWTQDAYPSTEIRDQCIDVIEKFYNSAYQVQVIERALEFM